MDILKKRFINLKKNQFTQDGDEIVYYTMQLETVGDDVSPWDSDLTLTVSEEIITALELDIPEVVNELRGKDVVIKGRLHDNEVGYHDKTGNPRTRIVTKFKVDSIDLG